MACYLNIRLCIKLPQSYCMNVFKIEKLAFNSKKTHITIEINKKYIKKTTQEINCKE